MSFGPLVWGRELAVDGSWPAQSLGAVVLEEGQARLCGEGEGDTAQTEAVSLMADVRLSSESSRPGRPEAHPQGK